jgi:uncharacterized protein
MEPGSAWLGHVGHSDNVVATGEREEGRPRPHGVGTRFADGRYERRRSFADAKQQGGESHEGPTKRGLDATSSSSATSSSRPKRKRGFAVMDPAHVRELARRGGVPAHAAGTAHEFTSDEARAAGRKRGTAASTERREGHSPSEATGATGEAAGLQWEPC